MRKMVYGNAMRTGWILTLIGLAVIVTGAKLAGSTGRDGYFALAALGLLFAIFGIVTLCVYAAMERGVSRAFKDSAPLLRFTIPDKDYAAYAAAQAEEIRSSNKMSLVIVLIFCGLMAIVGPLLVKESGIIYTFTGIGLALFIMCVSWIATKYRTNKLNSADKEAILTLDSAYVGGQFHLWKLPVGFLTEVVYFGAGEYEKSPHPVIRITYNAITRTIVTPNTILIPVPAGMEEKARAAVQSLRGSMERAKKRSAACVALLLPVLLLSACSANAYDASDRMMASDKAVSKDDIARVTSYLLSAVPAIRSEQAKFAEGGKKIKLVLNILTAPDREYTKNDPDYMNHEKNYYEVYVSYNDKDTPGPLKYDTYRVHKDLIDIYRYDSDTDDYVKVAP